MPRIHNVGGVRPLPFLYVPAVLNIVTNGNGTGTNNVFKWSRALGFEFSIQFSVYGATTVAKVSLFSTLTRCTVVVSTVCYRNIKSLFFLHLQYIAVSYSP